MFTGIVEASGEVVALDESAGGARITVRAPAIFAETRVGDSIAVNGCCLTVSRFREGQFGFNLLEETLMRTNLSQLTAGRIVNLERALSADGRIGGHFVQGHIDCTSRVLSFELRGADYRLEIKLPAEFVGYIAIKGSIAIDGISLTVSEVQDSSFAVWIIPHTLAVTNLCQRTAGDLVNLEFDLLAKYVERILSRRSPALTSSSGRVSGYRPDQDR